jgi:uncharacterized protein YdhG (YjbR/CyaY superfamily)
MQTKNNSIYEYISNFPENIQNILTEIRTIIQEIAPDATEKISYGIPTFYLNDNLVHFAAYKNHIGFYPGASGIEKFQKEISIYKNSKGTIQFPLNEDLPIDLIKKIVAFRINENKKMTLSLETPALLFSATSLILLAYTNRFLTIAQIVRGLKKNYDDNQNKSILLEIKNLNLRLTLIRYMQLFGVMCLFLSVFAMLLLYINQSTIGIYIFGASLLSLLISLGISFWEISISVNALRVHLKDLSEDIE